MRYLTPLCAALLLALWVLPRTAASEEPYASTCDGAVPWECIALAAKYLDPNASTPPFPHDPKRADALLRIAIDGALDACGGRDPKLCFVLLFVPNTLSEPLSDPRYTPSNLFNAYVTLNETACAKGIRAACYNRAIVFSPESADYETGLQREIAGGLTRPQAEAALAAENEIYRQRAAAIPTQRAQDLRTSCSPETPADCSALALLLADYPQLRQDSFEHLTLALAACRTDDRSACTAVEKAIFELDADPAHTANQARKAQTLAALETTCAAGNGAHCVILAYRAEVETLSLSGPYLETACTSGAGDACLMLAHWSLSAYGEDKSPDTLERATDLADRACQLKTNEACHILEHLSKG